MNPYWPGTNPFTQTGSHRFYNAVRAMPQGRGELFCAGHCWMADGRLLVAGGTKRYPIQTGTPGVWEGERFVWQWDETPVLPTDPFGRWHQMPVDLEADRWYPTVRYDGTVDRSAIVIGGTNIDPNNPAVMEMVNSYEVVRVLDNNFPPLTPALRAFPNDFDRKNAATPPPWNQNAPSSQRQYWGPQVLGYMGFGDYPRLHPLGIWDTYQPFPPTLPSATGPRLFVSGFLTWGIRWVHDKTQDTTFTVQSGFDIGQMPAGSDAFAAYATSILLPGSIGGIPTRIARLGGWRSPVTNGPSEVVEAVDAAVSPSVWQTGAGSIPAMTRKRYHGNVVILPNGQLFAVDGRWSLAGILSSFNFTPELLTNSGWVAMGDHDGPRDYHSTAILLPDARVLIAGGEHRTKDYQIWSPPYLHLDWGGDRPTDVTVLTEPGGVIVSDQAIGAMGYNSEFRATWSNPMPAGVQVERVVLMRPAALTHHDDGGQMMVRLVSWDDGVTDSIVFRSPTTIQHAPPGLVHAVPGDERWGSVDGLLGQPEVMAMRRTAWIMAIVAVFCGCLDAQDLLWRADGVNGHVLRGLELRRLGDCNGDGWEDLLERGGATSGHVIRVTSGRNGSILSSSPQPQGWVVVNIQPLGDMDQDGVPDYGICTYDGANPMTTFRLEVHSGASHALLWMATIPNAAANQFGAQFAGELDVNGDGRNDLVTIAPYLSPTGTILVYDNSGVELYRIVDPLPNGITGLKVAPLHGDLDGDGCGDFLATGPHPPSAPYEAGAVIVFSGRTGAMLRYSPGEMAHDALITPAGCGDLDGDGIPDYAGAGWAGNSVVTAFSGATGQVIRSWRDPADPRLGTCLMGGFDLDQDGVNDLVAGSNNRWANALSGRDGTFLFRWRDSRYPGSACIGQTMAMLAPPPGEQYPVLVWSESCWNPPGWTHTLPAGVIFAYRGCPPGVRAYGQPSASQWQQPPLSGMRTPTTSVVRFTMSNAAAAAGSLLLLGTSQTHLGSMPLPAPLGPLGFPGATLLQSTDAALFTIAGTSGIDRGYASIDVQLPNGRALATSGTPLFAQWLWFDPTSLGDHASTAGQRFFVR